MRVGVAESFANTKFATIGQGHERVSGMPFIRRDVYPGTGAFRW
jgi:hypothetical protein